MYLFFVDDLLCIGTGPMLNHIINKMKSEFKMEDLGLVSYYLGISINQNLTNGITTLDQSQYLKKY